VTSSVSSTRSRSDIRGRREGNYTVYQHEDYEAKDTDLDIAAAINFGDYGWLESINAGIASGEIEVFDHCAGETEAEVPDHSDSSEIKYYLPKMNGLDDYRVCDPNHHERPIQLRVSNLTNLQPHLGQRPSNQPGVQRLADDLRANPHIIRPMINCVNLQKTRAELMPTDECKEPWNESTAGNQVVSGIHLVEAAQMVNGPSEGPELGPQIVPHLSGHLYAFGGLAPGQIRGYLQTLGAVPNRAMAAGVARENVDITRDDDPDDEPMELD